MRYYLVIFKYKSSANAGLSRCGLHHLDDGCSQVMCANSQSSPYYWYDFYTNDLDYSHIYNISMLEKNPSCTVKLITRKDFNVLVKRESVFRELSA